MDNKTTEGLRERSRRPIRNKRYNRRVYGEEKRVPKRLFTPEIKRFLKDWLIRRRDNPYPNRDEKKILANQTGLTYIQVCNWFANWRRKLKNAGKEPQRKTWGHLIKTYNNQVQGNVEHFSICSDDSIWEEETDTYSSPYNKIQSQVKNPSASPTYKTISITKDLQNCQLNSADHSYTTQEVNKTTNSTNNNIETHQNQYIYLSNENDFEFNPFAQQHINKYKNHIMEKYLRDCQKPENSLEREEPNKLEVENTKPSMISKWLESAVNFKPSENNYLNWTITSTPKKKSSRKCSVKHNRNNSCLQHDREELDAAEALTKLANIHATLKI